VASPILILAVVGTMGCSALLALAFGRAAAHADDERASELRLLTDALGALGDWRAQALSPNDPRAVRRRETGSRINYAGIAGLATAHETISREPSITLPSSNTKVGTMRLPVSRSTS
jgi:hypothetical protein